MKYGGVSVLSCHIIYPFMVPLSYPIHVCICIHIMYLIKHVPHQACIYISLYQYQYIMVSLPDAKATERDHISTVPNKEYRYLQGHA